MLSSDRRIVLAIVAFTVLVASLPLLLDETSNPSEEQRRALLESITRNGSAVMPARSMPTHG